MLSVTQGFFAGQCLPRMLLAVSVTKVLKLLMKASFSVSWFSRGSAKSARWTWIFWAFAFFFVCLFFFLFFCFFERSQAGLCLKTAAACGQRGLTLGLPLSRPTSYHHATQLIPSVFLLDHQHVQATRPPTPPPPHRRPPTQPRRSQVCSYWITRACRPPPTPTPPRRGDPKCVPIGSPARAGDTPTSRAETRNRSIGPGVEWWLARLLSYIAPGVMVSTSAFLHSTWSDG